MPNFLEQLVAEWYEFRGFYVRRNVKVGKLSHGGHGGELDIVAYHPVEQRLVHIEPSMDAHKWEERERRYKKKFEIGRREIPALFAGFKSLPKLEQIALFVQGSNKSRPTIGGGKVMMISELMADIHARIRPMKVLSQAIPEQYVILRTLQFAANYWSFKR
jgi:hypothetical protein